MTVSSLLLGLPETLDWVLFFLLKHQASFLLQLRPSWSASDMWRFQYAAIIPHFSFSKADLTVAEVQFQIHLDQHPQFGCARGPRQDRLLLRPVLLPYLSRTQFSSSILVLSCLSVGCWRYSELYVLTQSRSEQAARQALHMLLRALIRAAGSSYD